MAAIQLTFTFDTPQELQEFINRIEGRVQMSGDVGSVAELPAASEVGIAQEEPSGQKTTLARAAAAEAAKKLPGEVKPAAQALLDEAGITLPDGFKGTGKDGSILKKDVVKYMASLENTPDAPSLDEVKAALAAYHTALKDKSGKDTADTVARALLATFEAGKVSEVKPEQRAEFIAAAQEGLKNLQAESKPVPEPTPKAKGNNAGVTEEDAREALSALIDARGMSSSLIVLQEFGVQRITELKDDQLPAFVARAQELAS